MIYADANILIRLLEGIPAVRAPIELRLLPLRGTGRFLGTSRLSRLECRCKPLRAGDTALLVLYEALFNGPEVQLLDVTPDVVEKATDLRARLNVKTPDAIHLATAIEAKVVAFLTGDRSLARCGEIAVEIL
jgi:predicted nucleic acid-binding protein